MEAHKSTGMMAQRYRIERYLTEGGMGAIYLGKKIGPGGFEKEVVLKQLLPEHTTRPEFRDLFFREAKISATLDHANIVHTFDLVESEAALFIVMEYVRGADLRSITRRAKIRRRELSTAAAVHIALEILAGLGYAHARRAGGNGAPLGIIHRDVSPSNILCSAQGEVKLTDFGIAKATTHRSAFYRVRGKVGYMSPEQARNEAIDARSDLYSLAVCLHETLAGERLFIGDLTTPPEEIYGQPVPRVGDRRRGVPDALDAVLARALSPVSEARFQDAAAFAGALRAVAHRHGLTFSAPELAAHLADMLGPDPERWLHEDADLANAANTQKIALDSQAGGLAGREASSVVALEDGSLVSESGVLVLASADAVMDAEETPEGRRRTPTPTDLFQVQETAAPLPASSRGQRALRRRPPTAADGFIRLEDDDEEPTIINPAPARRTEPAAVPRPSGPFAMRQQPSQPQPQPRPPGPFAKQTLFGMPAPRLPEAPPLAAATAAAPEAVDPAADMVTPAPVAPLFAQPTSPALAPRPFVLPAAAPAPSMSTPPLRPTSFSFEDEAPAFDPDDVSWPDQAPLAAVRAEPPRWASAAVLFGAALLGAGAAHLVTRGDLAAPAAVAAPAAAPARR